MDIGLQGLWVRDQAASSRIKVDIKEATGTRGGWAPEKVYPETGRRWIIPVTLEVGWVRIVLQNVERRTWLSSLWSSKIEVLILGSMDGSVKLWHCLEFKETQQTVSLLDFFLALLECFSISTLKSAHLIIKRPYLYFICSLFKL